MIKLLSILLLSIYLYAEATFDQVQSMIDKQQYKQAVLALTIIANNHPASSKVQYTLAQAQAGLGNLPAANAALDSGVKPQVARGIIPQCAYTVAWCAMQPKQFDSFIKLRTDSHAQWEINQLSNAMLEITA